MAAQSLQLWPVTNGKSCCDAHKYPVDGGLNAEVGLTCVNCPLLHTAKRVAPRIDRAERALSPWSNDRVSGGCSVNLPWGEALHS